MEETKDYTPDYTPSEDRSDNFEQRGERKDRKPRFDRRDSDRDFRRDRDDRGFGDRRRRDDRDRKDFRDRDDRGFRERRDRDDRDRRDFRDRDDRGDRGFRDRDDRERRDFRDRRDGRFGGRGGDRRKPSFDRDRNEERPLPSTNYLFGMHPVLEAIEAGKQIDKVFLKTGSDGELYRQLFDKITENQIPFQFVPVEKLNKITMANHQGVIAVIPQVDYVEFETVMERTAKRTDRVPLMIMLDGVTDVRNFGAIVRTAECAGASAVLMPAKGCAAINADAIKTSAGALLRVDICRVATLKKAVAELQEAGYTVIAATEKAEEEIYSADMTGPTVIVVGSEATGISEGVLELCNKSVRIPMAGAIGSLNVSVASAVVMYEALRQRNCK